MTRRLFILSWSAVPAAVGGGIRNARVRVRRLDRPSEDSSGTLEFTVSSDEAFPIRAVDPVLYVGNREVVAFRYADSKTLVFKSTDAGSFQDGSLMVLQYGGDEESRTELGRFRRSEVQ